MTQPPAPTPDRNGCLFLPSVRVLSAAPDAPSPPDVSLSGLIQRFPGLAEATAVCWTGSRAVGWGNELSDLDLYAFSDTDIELPTDESSETWTTADKAGARWSNWAGQYGGVLADLKISSVNALRDLLSPHLSGAEPEMSGLGPTAQDFVYRMAVAVPLKNEEYFAEGREMIYGSSYRRALARELKAYAENLLVDVVGQARAGDEQSARLAATMAAAVTADQCLVLSGELCRRKKWLMRRLATAPGCGISLEEYQAEVVDGPRSGESDGAYALRVGRWSQTHLARTEGEALGRR